MRTVFFVIIFLVFMVATLPWFIPFLFLIPFRRARQIYIGWTTTAWGRFCLWLAGAKVEVKGRGNLPEKLQPGVCYISNHQGYADIFSILSAVPGTVGFVAKKEIRLVPFIGLWMETMHCLFMDRKNMRKSMKTIQRGIRNIEKGYPMLIFPEGTRSQSDKLGSFKAGSLKLATRSRATIYPLTVQGSYHIFEEHKGVRPGRITVTAHPAIPYDTYREWDKKTLTSRLEEVIGSALPAGEDEQTPQKKGGE